MMVNISRHPAAIRHGLANARQIIRDPKGIHSDQHVLDACDYLMENGGSADVNEARLVREAIRLSWQSDPEVEANEDARAGLTLLAFSAAGTLAYLLLDYFW